MNPAAPARRTLWAATVRTKPLAERLAAATAGGYNAQSIFPLDVKNWLTEGHTLATVRDEARAAGAPITILDPFTKWLPRWEPPASTSAADQEFVDFDQHTFFEYAAGLQVEKMSVIESFGTKYDMAELVTSFQRICDAAREHGLRVQLEFMPISSIPDLATGWEIVRRASRENGGLVFDTWHYFRGRPDDALLAQVPGEKIFSVQVADAKAELQGGSLYADLMHHRLPAGLGSFPLADTVQVLRQIKGLDDVGVELFSDKMDALPAVEAGRQTGESLRRLLQ